MSSAWQIWLTVTAELIIFSLFWAATARLQKNNRFKGLYYLAGFNILMAGGLVLVIMRASWPDLLTKVGASSLELMAIAFLWHGGALLVEVPTRVEAFAVAIIGSLLTLVNQLFNDGNDSVREAILFLSISWMTIRAGWCAWISLYDRDNHYRFVGAALLGIAIVATLIMSSRSLLGIWHEKSLQLAGSSISSYVASLAVMLVLLMVNGMLAYTVVRTLLRDLEHHANHDALTGLKNRRAFWEFHNRQWQEWLRNKRCYALLCFDIDHFKSVNDTFGHAAGDQALKAVSAILAQNSRPMDCTARIGGEEFVMLLREVDASQAVAIAERIRHEIQTLPPLLELCGRSLTTSVGIALVSAKIKNAEHLLERADQALYQAKAAGRNQVVLHTSSTGAAKTTPESVVIGGAISV